MQEPLQKPAFSKQALLHCVGIVGAGLLYSLGINLFVVPSLRPKQESDKVAVEAPPNVIAADTMMEELHECPALPASTADEAPGWNWTETNIDEFEEE